MGLKNLKLLMGLTLITLSLTACGDKDEKKKDNLPSYTEAELLADNRNLEDKENSLFRWLAIS